MRPSVLLITCRFANIVFSHLDGSRGSRATSFPTFLLFLWSLLARVQCRSAPLLLLFYARMYHRIDPQIFFILFIPFSFIRGDSSEDGGVGVVVVIYFGGAGCGES